MSLHRTELGACGSRVVFCHGLFGHGRNWTQIAKALSAEHRVLLLDMPNHGRSPWTETVDYLEFADLVAAEIGDEPATLVGHSMGGKISMCLALRHPEIVERLAVVDIAPAAYDSEREFIGYARTMRALDLDGMERRSEVDTAMAAAVPDAVVRSFLLQNLRRTDDGWRWLPHLELLAEQMTELAGWPADRLGAATYDGPVLWVGGALSDYVAEEHAVEMDRRFPRNRRVLIKGAGHWVHSEQPEVFLEVLRRFLS